MSAPTDKVLPGDALTKVLVTTGVLSRPGAALAWARKARVKVNSVTRAAKGETISRCDWTRLDHVTRHPDEPLPEDCGGRAIKKWGGLR